MTDWRQIQARIRKAKNSPDALSKLSELFQRTRDGMVAWELGAIEEKSERTSEAVKWYTVAAERFRRAEWKKKAEEALARLGVSVPVAIDRAQARSGDNHSEQLSSFPGVGEENEAVASQAPAQQPAYAEISESDYDETQTPFVDAGSGPAPAAPDTRMTSDPQKRKRRRGRRGGRGRRRKDGTSATLPNQAFAESIESRYEPPSPGVSTPLPFRTAEPMPQPPGIEPGTRAVERPAPVPIRPIAVETATAPQLPTERTAHGRAGDPALASRMAQLESMLRRLLSSAFHRLDEAEQAPAGPGVFLLSDSDQITSYYVEACQTLRVGLGNLLRGGRAGKSSRTGRSYPEAGLKSRLADHLGINESKVAQYMKDHCMVRWIQLDEEASHLAHFAIGVLRTPLNLE